MVLSSQLPVLHSSLVHELPKMGMDTSVKPSEEMDAARTGSPEKRPEVSVVIVNWNTRDMLRDCLKSIHEQTQDIPFEVIVVDNASSDDSASMVRDEFPQVLLIANEENLGFAAANNQGFEKVRGRYVLMLNPDTVVLDRAITKSVRYAEDHPEVGVVGCRVLWPDRRRQNSCFRFHSIGNIALSSLAFFRMHRFFRWPILHPDRYLNRDFSREQDVDVVAGCFFLIPREILSEVGTLDEDFFMYGEEAEFCHRVRRTGRQVRYFPGAEIIHLYGGSSDQVFHEMSLSKRLAVLLFMDKTRGFVPAWVCNAFMLLGVLLRLPLWLVQGAIRCDEQGRRTLKGKWAICKAHAAGVFRPAWRRG